jgi:pyruvate,water dikinase
MAGPAPVEDDLVVAQERVDPEADPGIAPRVGGKALALAAMARAGIAVPPFVVVTTGAYAAYLRATGLGARIGWELERKDVADMRWEELWDAALRIRSLFLTTPLPEELRAALAEPLAARFTGVPVVVRSSAPGEDSAGASFAGLHESYVNVRGLEAILENVRLVWASLWSDAALLYRRELGLDPRRSEMAVVVQEVVAGERSGVAFSRHPEDEGRALVEAVHGLNQGLVDGVVEPDRWTVRRSDGVLLEHRPAERVEMMAPAPDGVRLEPLPAGLCVTPPLAEEEVPEVYGLARRAEGHFAAPQDVEWTLRGERLFALQSRPITTLSGAAGDGRAAYLSLRRSFESLEKLRRRIEDEDLPALAAAADELAAVDLRALDDAGLPAALRARKDAHERGVDVYTTDFIPFAHGVRLFGQDYNEVLRPEDPFEFTDLLTATPMLSLRRNAALESIAARLREREGEAAADEADAFVAEFGGMTGVGARDEVLALASRLQGAAGRAPSRAPGDPEARVRRYLEAHPEEERARAEDLLDLARASWRLRDDDNLYLGRLERLLEAAIDEAGRRGLAVADEMRPRPVTLPSPLASPEPDGELARPVRPAGAPAAGAGPGGDLAPAGDDEPAGLRTQARQIVGQPAGPGIAVGTARVVRSREDLAAFAPGEILVCDAIEPEMTFVVPLAAGIVERRGGMLIHGAIIAREYGLPCVTGAPRAVDLIRTGDRLTVDGYLGIVTIAR